MFVNDVAISLKNRKLSLNIDGERVCYRKMILLSKLKMRRKPNNPQMFANCLDQSCLENKMNTNVEKAKEVHFGNPSIQLWTEELFPNLDVALHL